MTGSVDDAPIRRGTGREKGVLLIWDVEVRRRRGHPGGDGHDIWGFGLTSTG